MTDIDYFEQSLILVVLFQVLKQKDIRNFGGYSFHTEGLYEL